MEFETELARVLPSDIPHRERLIEKSSRHLRLIASANEYMNLTRIVSPQDAAIKHVYDSVIAWRYFAEYNRVLDAGTGGGFPGIPLAIVLPEVRFVLADSVQKKARFVDSAVEDLELCNAHVTADRAEKVAELLQPDAITARALAPVPRIIDLFRKSLKQGSRLILFKGPDADRELADARECHVNAELLCQYELPDGLGTRTLIGIGVNSAGRAAPRRRAQATQ